MSRASGAKRAWKRRSPMKKRHEPIASGQAARGTRVGKPPATPRAMIPTPTTKQVTARPGLGRSVATREPIIPSLHEHDDEVMEEMEEHGQGQAAAGHPRVAEGHADQRQHRDTQRRPAVSQPGHAEG